jgi:hypothetical protein
MRLADQAGNDLWAADTGILTVPRAVAQRGAASTSEYGVLVGTIRSSVNPAASSRVEYSAAVRLAARQLAQHEHEQVTRLAEVPLVP